MLCYGEGARLIETLPYDFSLQVVFYRSSEDPTLPQVLSRYLPSPTNEESIYMRGNWKEGFFRFVVTLHNK